MSMTDYLNLHFGGYTETWYTSLWLKFRSRQYRKRRDRIVLNICKKRANRMIRREIMKPIPDWLTSLQKTDCFSSSLLAYKSFNFDGDE